MGREAAGIMGEMIRRESGNEFLLMTQNDHAVLAGELARHVGNEMFAPPTPMEPVITAIARHDCGWRDLDQHPTSRSGIPAHIFECDIRIAISAWTQSVRVVSAMDSYAGLLVSLHAMSLAVAASRHYTQDESDQARDKLFRLNQFLHRQIEIQESLRAGLNLRIDLPLHCGLAEPGRSAEEDLLLANFGLLQFMDRVSLNLCFDRLVFGGMAGVYPRPGAGSIKVTMVWREDGRLSVDPWPFDTSEIELQIAAKRMAARRFEQEADLHAAYVSAARENLSVGLSEHT